MSLIKKSLIIEHSLMTISGIITTDKKKKSQTNKCNHINKAILLGRKLSELSYVKSRKRMNKKKKKNT